MSVLIILLFLLALPALAQPTLDELAPRLAPLAKIQTLQADFTQIRHFSELDYDMTVTGKMTQDHGKRLAWQTISPIKSTCIFTESSFVIWDEDSHKKNSLNADKYPWVKLIFQLQNNWMHGDLSTLKQQFEIKILNDTTISLTPLDQTLKSLFSQITIQFAKDYTAVLNVQFTEKTGDSISLTFHNILANHPIPETFWERY